MTDYNTDKLILEVDGHTAVITFNNLPANTWTEDSLKGLAAMVEDLNANRDVYALVLRSTSDKFFSAGADLKLFADGDRTVARDMGRYFGLAFETLSYRLQRLMVLLWAVAWKSLWLVICVLRKNRLKWPYQKPRSGCCRVLVVLKT